MTKQKYLSKKPDIAIAIDPAPKGELKALGGADRDQWNKRLSTLVTRALPVNQKDVENVSLAGSAAIAGIVDMKPADPIEGVLIAQIVVAYEAAMKLYPLGWAKYRRVFRGGYEVPAACR